MVLKKATSDAVVASLIPNGAIECYFSAVVASLIPMVPKKATSDVVVASLIPNDAIECHFRYCRSIIDF